MADIKDFAARPKDRGPKLPLQEDRIGHLIVGYMVEMTRGTRTRTYWYRTLKDAYRAHLRFTLKGRWPKHKQIRKSVDIPPPAAV